ncbi:MAG: class I SAM-dependent methyltransferase [Myxococcota bacterium]
MKFDEGKDGGSDHAARMLRGETLGDEDWNAYLRSAHGRLAGASPEVFAGHDVLDGVDSYQLVVRGLLDSKEELGTIVDLACGDGHLIGRLMKTRCRDAQFIGVDMSPDEIELARSKWEAQPNVRFICEQAHSMSLTTGSVDAIVCHAALMLMRPLEPVASEIRRVLKTGGVFVAMISSSRPPAGAITKFGPLIRRFFLDKGFEIEGLQMGDPATRNPDGLRSVFSRERGFVEADVNDGLVIRKRFAVEKAWEQWRDSYLVDLLDTSQKQELREAITELAAVHADSQGSVVFETPIQLLVARA